VQTLRGLKDTEQIFEGLSYAFQRDPSESPKEVRDGVNADFLDTVYWMACLKTSPNVAHHNSWSEDMRRVTRVPLVRRSIKIAIWMLLKSVQRVELVWMVFAIVLNHQNTNRLQENNHIIDEVCMLSKTTFSALLGKGTLRRLLQSCARGCW